jgi:hypothetical protein
MLYVGSLYLGCKLRLWKDKCKINMFELVLIFVYGGVVVMFSKLTIVDEL